MKKFNKVIWNKKEIYFNEVNWKAQPVKNICGVIALDKVAERLNFWRWEWQGEQ